MERIPCNKNSQDHCPVFGQEGACYEDIHHKYWPRRDYRTQVERQFRSLDINKVKICRAMHNEIHASRRKSDKPPREGMLRAIKEEQE